MCNGATNSHGVTCRARGLQSGGNTLDATRTTAGAPALRPSPAAGRATEPDPLPRLPPGLHPTVSGPRLLIQAGLALEEEQRQRTAAPAELEDKLSQLETTLEVQAQHCASASAAAASAASSSAAAASDAAASAASASAAAASAASATAALRP